MKKLMVMLGALATAVFAHAATIDWGIEYAMDPVTGGDMGGNYYAFFVASAGAGSTATFDRDLAIAALTDGDASFVNTYAIDEGVAFDWGEAVQYAVGSFDNAQTISGYAVILNAATVADATKAFITEVGSTAINNIGGADTLQFGDISEATAVAGNWYNLGSAPIPEPTSGLLILLGMAGLALRRRRA